MIAFSAQNGIAFHKSIQLLVYTDDIDQVSDTVAFRAVERDSTKMGLAGNEGKMENTL